MADQFKLQQIATYTQESPAQSFQPINTEDITVSPTNQESGKINLAAATPITSLCTLAGGTATILILTSTAPITVTIDSTKILEEVTLLTYKGKEATFEITANTTVDSVVTYAIVDA